MAQHGHPRYRGSVIDVHVHYHATTRHRALEVNAIGGLQLAIQLMDVDWPAPRYAEDLEAWRALEPGLRRCHVPDLSNVGAHGFEHRLEDELREAAALGCVGLKVWKNLGLVFEDADGKRLAVDDRRLDVLWATAGELGLPTLIHVGDPPAMWAPLTDDNPRLQDLTAHPEWWYGDGRAPSLAQIHEEFEGLVAAHPTATFVGAHFGCFLSDDELRRWFETYPNFHADTAAAIAEIGHGDIDSARQLFLDFPDRILFGTDLARTPAFEYPEMGARRWDLAEYFGRHWRFFETAETDLPHPIPEQLPWNVTGIDLPESVLRALYFDNAARLYPVGVAAESGAGA